MAKSQPWKNRRGPPGSIYGLPTLNRLVCAAAGVPVLEVPAARAVLARFGLRVSKEQFPRIWSGREPIGHTAATDLLNVVNLFRNDCRRVAATAQHIVAYEGWVYVSGGLPAGYRSEFDVMRGACGVMWSDDMLEAVLARHMLVAMPVAQSISVGANAAGITAAPLPAAPNSCGKVVATAKLRQENDDYLGANGLAGFEY